MNFSRAIYNPAPVTQPRFARWFFDDPRSAWLWLAVRLYVGWEWFTAGREKIWAPAGSSSWLDNGNSLKAYWQRATAEPATGNPPIVYGWYRHFIKYMLDNGWYDWFAKLVAIGEFAIGIAIIFGAFVGIAAFFGTFMNFNFMLAGSASINPVLFGLAVFLLLAWRVAGTIGLDRWILPVVRTPWNLGRAVTERGERRPPRPSGRRQPAS